MCSICQKYKKPQLKILKVVTKLITKIFLTWKEHIYQWYKISEITEDLEIDKNLQVVI